MKTNKYFQLLSLLLSITSLNTLCLGQIKPMGFTQKIENPPSNRFFITYRPKLQIINDTLFVCSNSGIYQKDMTKDNGFSLFAFDNIPITEFVKNNNDILAISPGSRDGKDSLMFLSTDNGKTHTNFTHPHFFEEEEYNYPLRIVQNPENPNSLLLLHYCYGLSKSTDFGKNWENLNEMRGGYQDWFAGFHPSDTAHLFYSGEMAYFAGYIFQSTDNGVNWSNQYPIPDIDQCIHHIAFHPTNPDVLIFSAEVAMGKSTDKGKSWNYLDLEESGMYFYKVLFDEENPNVLYASGIDRKYSENDTLRVYRSLDTGNSWQLAYNEPLNESCGGVYDMVKYKNKLIFYTRDCGLFELDLEKPPVSIQNTKISPELTAYLTSDYNILDFETDLVINRIEIADMTGKLVRQINVKGQEKTTDISPLNNGIYLVTFYTAGKEQVTKKIHIIR